MWDYTRVLKNSPYSLRCIVISIYKVALQEQIIDTKQNFTSNFIGFYDTTLITIPHPQVKLFKQMFWKTVSEDAIQLMDYGKDQSVKLKPLEQIDSQCQYILLVVRCHFIYKFPVSFSFILDHALCICVCIEEIIG